MSMQSIPHQAADDKQSYTGELLAVGGVAAIFIVFGFYKFTTKEAEAIYPLLQNSPFFSWLYLIFSKQGASDLIGFVEIVLGALMVWRGNWRACLIGSCGVVLVLLSTLSFLATTPGIGFEPFLIKDIALLGVAMWSISTVWQRRPHVDR
jgi:reactive chlorine resistance protein C